MSIYLSLILAISVYFSTYNLSQIMYRYFSDDEKNTQMFVSIISFTLQMIISLTLLAHAKDLIFSLCITYFIIAYFVSERFLSDEKTKEEYVGAIVLLILNALTFTYSLFKYKLEAFGLIKDNDVDSVINNMICQKISSVS